MYSPGTVLVIVIESFAVPLFESVISNTILFVPNSTGTVQEKTPNAGLIHHSDRGSQYCSHNYQKLLDQFGMKSSMSRKGNCYDNAPMESFLGSLKNELVHHCRYATRAEAEASIREYIEIFYNRQRRHSRLGYLAPAVFLKNFNLKTAAACDACVHY